jgi:hypothetical protein
VGYFESFTRGGSAQTFTKMSKRGISAWTAFVVACVALGTVLVLPLFARSTNCGGNSAALSACRSVILGFQIVGLDRGDKAFRIEDLTQIERENFRNPTGMSWLPGAKLLVSQLPIRITLSEPKKILAVCDSAYDNVPQSRFWKSPMSHAVAYSDGSVGLIPVSVFRHSDFSRFVDVASVPQSVSNKPMLPTTR